MNTVFEFVLDDHGPILVVFDHIVAADLDVGLEELESTDFLGVVHTELSASVENLLDVVLLLHSFGGFQFGEGGYFLHGLVVGSLLVAHASEGDEFGDEVANDIFFLEHSVFVHPFVLSQSHLHEGLFVGHDLEAVHFLVVFGERDLSLSLVVVEFGVGGHILADFVDFVGPSLAVGGDDGGPDEGFKDILVFAAGDFLE